MGSKAFVILPGMSQLTSPWLQLQRGSWRRKMRRWWGRTSPSHPGTREDSSPARYSDVTTATTQSPWYVGGLFTCQV